MQSSEVVAFDSSAVSTYSRIVETFLDPAQPIASSQQISVQSLVQVYRSANREPTRKLQASLPSMPFLGFDGHSIRFIVHDIAFAVGLISMKSEQVATAYSLGQGLNSRSSLSSQFQKFIQVEVGSKSKSTPEKLMFLLFKVARANGLLLLPLLISLTRSISL